MVNVRSPIFVCGNCDQLVKEYPATAVDFHYSRYFLHPGILSQASPISPFFIPGLSCFLLFCLHPSPVVQKWKPVSLQCNSVNTNTQWERPGNKATGWLWLVVKYRCRSFVHWPSWSPVLCWLPPACNCVIGRPHCVKIK